VEEEEVKEAKEEEGGGGGRCTKTCPLLKQIRGKRQKNCIVIFRFNPRLCLSGRRRRREEEEEGGGRRRRRRGREMHENLSFAKTKSW
jgi:hypothetical protein